MKFGTTALILTLLITGILSQAASPVFFSDSNSNFQYTSGTGAQDDNSLGNRDAGTGAIVGDNTIVFTTPSQQEISHQKVRCPYLQTYSMALWQCTCILGYHFQGDDCVPNHVPRGKCPTRQNFRDGRCVCDEGYYQIGLTCDVCPPYSAYDVNTLSCFCIPGYTIANSQCAEIIDFPQLPVPKPPKCGVNQRLVGGNCICLENHFLVKGVCTLCLAPDFYDASLQICRPTCSDAQLLDLSTLRCICVGGTFFIDGICKNCPPFSSYNKYSQTCDCINGFILNDGNCIPRTYIPTPPPIFTPPSSSCPDVNQFLVNNLCVCKFGYYLINNKCQQCASGTFYDPDLKVCRIPCNANEVYNLTQSVCDCAPNHFRNSNNICISCPGSSVFNITSRLCSCPVGQSLIGGLCIVGCGVNEVLKNGLCCCKQGYYPVDGKCGKCKWNEIYDEGLGICRKPCDRTRIWSIQKSSCVCLPQFFEFADGQCGYCPKQSTYSSETKKCVCNPGFTLSLGRCIKSCNPYEDFVNGTCQCKPGYYLIGYSCGVCPPLLHYDATYRICRSKCGKTEIYDPTTRICRCLPGFYLVDGMCKVCNSENQVYNQRTQCCDCIDGYHKVNGYGCHGKCIPNCAPNEDWIADRCVCKPGYFLINNMCTRCPEGQKYDIYSRVCRHVCGPNQIYDFSKRKCVCVVGFYLVEGTCSKCREGQTYNAYTQKCSSIPCKDVKEFYSNITGTCICLIQYVKIRGVCSNCPPGFYYDSYSDSCLCKPGFKLAGGFCKPICPSNQIFLNGRCVCENGDIPNSYGFCRPQHNCPLFSHYSQQGQCCVCNSGFSLIGGKCSAYQYCGINGFQRYGQCACNPGYFWILNTCQSCGPMELFNGYVCECQIGYIRDNNAVCVKQNIVPTCYNNERYDSNVKSCICIAGTMLANGVCINIPSCPSLSYFNGAQCICQSGYILENNVCVQVKEITPTCPANAFFNGVACACKQNFYEIIRGSCSECPQGSNWNGVKCITDGERCADGYIYNPMTVRCEPTGPGCGQNSFWDGASCQCARYFHLINGQCESCKGGMVFDGKQCSQKTTKACESNQVWADGKCVCADGFNDFEGRCIKCPAYTTWNGKYCACSCNIKVWCMGQPFTDTKSSNCQCQSGYTKINGICAKQ